MLLQPPPPSSTSLVRLSARLLSRVGSATGAFLKAPRVAAQSVSQSVSLVSVRARPPESLLDVLGGPHLCILHETTTSDQGTQTQMFAGFADCPVSYLVAPYREILRYYSCDIPHMARYF